MTLANWVVQVVAMILGGDAALDEAPLLLPRPRVDSLVLGMFKYKRGLDRRQTAQT